MFRRGANQNEAVMFECGRFGRAVCRSRRRPVASEASHILLFGKNHRLASIF
jgi:hypothetical protein